MEGLNLVVAHGRHKTCSYIQPMCPEPALALQGAKEQSALLGFVPQVGEPTVNLPFHNTPDIDM